jgi:hypothetical protein
MIVMQKVSYLKYMNILDFGIVNHPHYRKDFLTQEKEG